MRHYHVIHRSGFHKTNVSPETSSDEDPPDHPVLASYIKGRGLGWGRCRRRHGRRRWIGFTTCCNLRLLLIIPKCNRRSIVYVHPNLIGCKTGGAHIVGSLHKCACRVTLCLTQCHRAAFLSGGVPSTHTVPGAMRRRRSKPCTRHDIRYLSARA